MNCSQIASELLFKRLSISRISEKHGISKAEVVKSIFDFFTLFPNSSHITNLKRLLKYELANDFLDSPCSAINFAEEYGLRLRVFRELMKEAIDDYKLFPVNARADILFRKLMEGTVIVSKSVPKRIVKQIACKYVFAGYITQDSLAGVYGTRRETISAILKRAISENIVNDVTAEKIIVKIRSYNKDITAYSEAFDERAKVKAEQA